MITVFSRRVNDIFALIECYAAWINSLLLTFRENLSVPPSWVKLLQAAYINDFAVILSSQCPHSQCEAIISEVSMLHSVHDHSVSGVILCLMFPQHDGCACVLLKLSIMPILEKVSGVRHIKKKCKSYSYSYATVSASLKSCHFLRIIWLDDRMGNENSI